MANQAFVFQFRQRRQTFGDRSLRGAHRRADAQIDHVDHVKAEVAQIIVHRVDNFLLRMRRNPGLVGPAPRADFGHNHQIFRVRMQRLFDQPVADVWPVKIGSVDVIHAGGDRFAQQCDRRVFIFRRSPHFGAG